MIIEMLCDVHREKTAQNTNNSVLAYLVVLCCFALKTWQPSDSGQEISH